MTELHFIRPWFLFGFVPLILIMSLLFQNKLRNNQWRGICDPHLLKALMVKIGKSHHYLRLFAIFCLGGIMILALAGPTWQRLPQPSFPKQQATVIALDLSTEMNGKDIKPSRLQRAKFKIEEMFKAIPEGQLGMVAFSREAFLVSPLTKDSRTLKLMLSELDPKIMPVDGSNIKSALKLSAKLLEQAGFHYGNIIVITANKASPADIRYAKTLLQKNFHTSVLAMATELGAPLFNRYGIQHISKLDQTSLKALVKAGKGSYQKFISNDTDVQQLAHFIHQEKADYRKKADQITVWKDQGRLLILVILPLLLLAFRRGFVESISP